MTSEMRYLNPDCLVSVFWYFPAYEVTALREVSKAWNLAASSNPLWMRLCRSDICDDLLYLERQSKVPASSKSVWFYRYLEAINNLPWLSRTRANPSAVSWVKMEFDEKFDYATSGFERSSSEVLVSMISSKPDKIGYQMHKLGAIMSVLSENGNVPMPYSLVVIGYSATDGILIPLSKFCFAVAHGREGELYPLAKDDVWHYVNRDVPLETSDDEENVPVVDQDEEDYLSNIDLHNEQLDPYTQEYQKEVGNDVERNHYYEESGNYRPRVAIGHLVEGWADDKLVPFAFYMLPIGSKGRRGCFAERAVRKFRSKTDSLVSQQTSGQVSSYHWRTFTDEAREWTPNFLNASFNWTYYGIVSTAYDPDSGCLLLLKVLQKETVW